MKLEPIKQQRLIPAFGKLKAHQSCLPTCFYILGKGYGYIQSKSIEEFVHGLNWKDNFNEKLGWFRPKLSRELRKEYGMKIISWQLLQKDVPTWANRRRMKKAGYFKSAKEWKFFKNNIAGKSVFEIVRSGHPVILTMLPEFDGNRDTHSVILEKYEGSKLKVTDPNGKNGNHLYTEQEINKSISPLGAGSVVLPK